MEFYRFDSPIGPLALGEEEGALVRVYLPSSPTPRLMSHPTPLLMEGAKQILQYLAGARKSFDLPLNPQGTEFQRKVWAALQTIPYGQTWSYKELAQAVNCPGGFQAVGQANGKNPLPILIPCHRVVAANGGLGGYAGGLELKRTLLDVERG